ncbi:hypothetical protein GpartN1_g6684.t1 [Galdieria partita]|uniref:Uncharacterized protein n=1 Tax=Galdieria partita TaxID=83374 RepID=A0A9C7Q1S1_9RHOD|nr:hypothetical protein GpartN1_g6678.t1 [Galdieria partita]GJQ14893.1 hypothetical protein GpartN1_g6684.t1 [Galdieria partita]
MSDLPVIKQRLDESLNNLEKLEKEVVQVETKYNDNTSFSCDTKKKEWQQTLSQQCKCLEEYLLQVALQVDGLEVSRESAAKAFREKRQEQAKEITQLLSRRKKTHEKVHQLLQRLDTVVAHLSSE